jgi:hypothetical protein
MEVLLKDHLIAGYGMAGWREPTTGQLDAGQSEDDGRPFQEADRKAGGAKLPNITVGSLLQFIEATIVKHPHLRPKSWPAPTREWVKLQKDPRASTTLRTVVESVLGPVSPATKEEALLDRAVLADYALTRKGPKQWSLTGLEKKGLRLVQRALTPAMAMLGYSKSMKDNVSVFEGLKRTVAKAMCASSVP